MPKHPHRPTIPMGEDLYEGLSRAAAERRTNLSLVARTLIADGLDRLPRDPALRSALDEAVEGERARRAEVGRAVMAERWGGGERDKKEERRHGTHQQQEEGE